jgi:hypothetical protein
MTGQLQMGERVVLVFVLTLTFSPQRLPTGSQPHQFTPRHVGHRHSRACFRPPQHRQPQLAEPDDGAPPAVGCRRGLGRPKRRATAVATRVLTHRRRASHRPRRGKPGPSSNCQSDTFLSPPRGPSTPLPPDQFTHRRRNTDNRSAPSRTSAHLPPSTQAWAGKSEKTSHRRGQVRRSLAHRRCASHRPRSAPSRRTAHLPPSTQAGTGKSQKTSHRRGHPCRRPGPYNNTW